jgi:hypothetical protein
VEGGSVLGLSTLRTAFLDHLSAATPNALTPSDFLTSSKEPPTLAAFSSSACALGPQNPERRAGCQVTEGRRRSR